MEVGYIIKSQKIAATVSLILLLFDHLCRAFSYYFLENITLI